MFYFVLLKYTINVTQIVQVHEKSPATSFEWTVFGGA